MAKLFILIIVFAIVSCDQKPVTTYDSTNLVDRNNVDILLKPFELKIIDYNFSLGYSNRYVLTNKDFSIIFCGEVQGEKDTVLFKTDLKPSTELARISNIQIDSLQVSYTNHCILDGSQISFKITRDNKSKTVHLSNYYLEDIGLAIELINGLAPKKYQIWYDKSKLIKGLENCK